jgi:hypothetical protein
MFPNFEGNETTEEKVDQIQNYLYMLVEQLRYSMANIGKENFNETEFDNIVNLITEPLYMQLTSEDGSVSQMIQASTEGLVSRIQGIETKVGEPAADGKEATGLFSKYTEITQTLNSITLSAVEDANGNTSKITLSADGITTQSANISFKGEVTFAQAQELANTAYTNATQDAALGLSAFNNGLKQSGYTTINGGNITTGIVDGVTFYARGEGQSFIVRNGGNTVGGIRYEKLYDFEDDPNGVYADKMYLYTQSYLEGGVIKEPSIKLHSAGRISVEAPYGLVYIKGTEYVTITDGITRWTFMNGGLYRNDTQVL